MGRTIRRSGESYMSARRDLDYFKLLKESREAPASERPGSKKIRLAVLGDCATQHLSVLLLVLFSRHGLDADIYEGPSTRRKARPATCSRVSTSTTPRS